MGLGSPLWAMPAPAPSGGGAVFSPSSLSPNVWIEAQDAGTSLFTNSAGTTPVASDGDVVGCWKDKSTNGRNLNDFDGNGSTVFPLYKTGGGKPYVLFDGTNDFLESAASAAYVDGSGQCWLSMACYFNVNTGTQTPVSTKDSSSTDWDEQFLRLTGGAANALVRDSTNAVVTDSGAAISAATAFVFTTKITTSAIEVFVNGVSGGSTAISNSLLTTTRRLRLGQVAAAQWFGGRIYGMVQGSGTLSSGNQTFLETYLATLY
jgi:hypothetical protein